MHPVTNNYCVNTCWSRALIVLRLTVVEAVEKSTAKTFRLPACCHFTAGVSFSTGLLLLVVFNNMLDIWLTVCFRRSRSSTRSLACQCSKLMLKTTFGTQRHGICDNSWTVKTFIITNWILSKCFVTPTLTHKIKSQRETSVANLANSLGLKTFQTLLFRWKLIVAKHLGWLCPGHNSIKPNL